MPSCPSDDTLATLLQGTLDGTPTAALDAHLAECGACRALVAQLARATPAPARRSRADDETRDSIDAAAHVGPTNAGGPAAWLDALMPLALAVAERSAQRRLGVELSERWTVEALLGTGGMAQVFAAVHRNGRKVAIKILRADLATDPELVRRFMLEAYAANRIDHPGVVAILDHGVTDDGAPFLVMERLEGETLRARLDRGPLTPEQAAHLGAQVLDVLDIAHRRGVVHRDIKPENLFLPKAGDVTVLDFGIARIRDLAQAAGTRSGLAMGTPAFMAPEQARGDSTLIDGRTDLWAVGATLFTALTGRAVHEGGPREQLLYRAMTRPAAPLRTARRGVPAPLARAVDRALSFDRDDRWPDARSMRAALLAQEPRRVPVRLVAVVASAGTVILGSSILLGVRPQHLGQPSAAGVEAPPELPARPPGGPAAAVVGPSLPPSVAAAAQAEARSGGIAPTASAQQGVSASARRDVAPPARTGKPSSRAVPEPRVQASSASAPSAGRPQGEPTKLEMPVAEAVDQHLLNRH